MEERDIVNQAEDGVEISEEVIAVITGIATSETEGIAAVGAGGIATSWAELISGKKNVSKGIKVTMYNEAVEIEVQLAVKYGVNIPDIAAVVQENVKNSVEEMTGLTVTKVDVKVSGIKTEAEERKKDKDKKSEEKG